jgi:hypothetical protein
VTLHSFLGGISLFKCFSFNRKSEPRSCANGFGSSRQENMRPMPKGCLIVLAKPDVLAAFHAALMPGDRPGAARAANILVGEPVRQTKVAASPNGPQDPASELAHG